MMKQVIIDTDPGPDDGVAILTALGSPLIEVLGVCAVAGNVPLHHTVRNVRKILELAERQALNSDNSSNLWRNWQWSVSHLGLWQASILTRSL